MIIYKITNTTNGKIYIGKSTTDIDTRWELHIKHAFVEHRTTKFCNALRKYGADSFTKQVLLDNIETPEILNERETYFIKTLDSINPTIGYNLSKGGDGGFTDEMRQKSAEVRKQNGITPEHKRALLEGRRLAGYKPKTIEEKKAASKRMKKYYQEHPDHLAKISEINKNKAMSGTDHPMWGQKHSVEARSKMRNARLGKSYEEIYGNEKAEKIRNTLKSKTGKQNPNYNDIDVELIKCLCEHPLITRQELSRILNCSGPTITKRFQQLLGVANLQKFRRNKTELELKTFFTEKLNGLLY